MRTILPANMPRGPRCVDACANAPLLTGLWQHWTMSRGRATSPSRWGPGTSIRFSMISLDGFNAIALRDEPLAPHTWLKIGGPAQYLLRPRHPEQLLDVVRRCQDEQLAV